jgi:hypothetical protein
MHFNVKPIFNYSLAIFFALVLLACSPDTADKTSATTSNSG